MDLALDMSVASAYRSPQQVVRVVTEAWGARNLYCPQCGRDAVERFTNNEPVLDYFCPGCGAQYELKAGRRRNAAKVVDGAYATMIERINSERSPHLLLLAYENSWVTDLLVIPRHFFTPHIIERKRPIAPGRRRAGWVGCNILVSQLPQIARIDLVTSRNIHPPRETVRLFGEASRLDVGTPTTRGWLLDVWRIIEQAAGQGQVFSLGDIYARDAELAASWPGNSNVRPKIRQQLQVLRDRGLISFLSDGTYRRC